MVSSPKAGLMRHGGCALVGWGWGKCTLKSNEPKWWGLASPLQKEWIPFSCLPESNFLLPSSPECMPGSFLYKDMCHQSCPNHFYEDARQCVPCHEDCLECSGPSADDCDLCAEESLVLYNGRCLDECPEGTYYEKMTKVCKGKDFQVHGQAPHPREPNGIMGLCWDKVGSRVCMVPAPELSSHSFPSCLRKHIVTLF